MHKVDFINGETNSTGCSMSQACEGHHGRAELQLRIGFKIGIDFMSNAWHHK